MSTLVLSMVDAPPGTRHETRHIMAERFTIGRDRENDWVLLDLARRLSRRHCVLQHDPAGWTVTDLSRNGVIHAHERAGHGSGAPGDGGRPGRLETGDVLRLGEYALSVRVEDDDSSFQLRPLPEFLDDLRRSLPDHASWHPPEPVLLPKNVTIRSTADMAARVPDRAPGHHSGIAAQDGDATMIVPLPIAAAAPALDATPPGGEGDRVAADPLFQLLGLDDQILSPERRSVALYRIASALDAMMRGMRRFPDIMHGAGAGDDTPFGAAWSREEMLRWIAGLSASSPLTPDSAIDTMFARLNRHQDAIHAAHRETARVLLDITDPGGVDVDGQGGRRAGSLGMLRRRHRRLRAQFDIVIDRIYRRAYAADHLPGGPAAPARQDGGDAREPAS